MLYESTQSALAILLLLVKPPAAASGIERGVSADDCTIPTSV